MVIIDTGVLPAWRLSDSPTTRGANTERRKEAGGWRVFSYPAVRRFRLSGARQGILAGKKGTPLSYTCSSQRGA